MSSATNDLSIEDRLREVYEKTDSREYAEALDALEMARTADPGNIYIAALRRQLDALLSLSQGDELGEDQRHELMEPMPGIIDCAIRDSHRQHRTGITDLPRARQNEVAPDVPATGRETESAPERVADPGDVQKELEALKLLYFQRASKFVMKGEYEQALAEVRRVFVVDPDNTIAREYASRVEHLIQHARQLASEPAPPADAAQEPPHTIEVEPEPAGEEPLHVHTERSTAWDEEFTAPKAPAPLPEHRPAPPSSRQTMAYGDSLAVSLSGGRDAGGEELEGPGRKKSKFFVILTTVILTPLLAGVAVAIFASKSPAPASRADVTARQAQTSNPAPSVEATIGAAGTRSAEETGLRKEEHRQVPAEVPVKSVPPPVVQKAEAEPPAAKTVVPVQTPPVEIAKNEPARVTAPAAETAPPSLPKSVPIEPPKSAPVESPKTPAFVAVERDPQIVRLEKPSFPGFVWKMGGEGQVVVRVLIDANGKPLDSQILKSTNPVFEQPVIDAVMKSQFNPAQMGQGPVAAWLTIPFKFKQPK